MTKGFKRESNYPCYKDKRESWCEVYLTANFPYGHIWLTGVKVKNYHSGIYFETPKDLKDVFKRYAYNNQTPKQ